VRKKVMTSQLATSVSEDARSNIMEAEAYIKKPKSVFGNEMSQEEIIKEENSTAYPLPLCAILNLVLHYNLLKKRVIAVTTIITP